MPAAPIDRDTAAGFVERFQEAWRAPNLALHEALWRDDIVLVQPLMGALHGKVECRTAFERLFALVPDLNAVVHCWSAADDAIFIEFTLRGTFGGRPIAWSAVDRFKLIDGQIAERISYFDAAPIAVTMATRPRGWRRLLRTRFRPRVRSYVHSG